MRLLDSLDSLTFYSYNIQYYYYDVLRTKNKMDDLIDWFIHSFIYSFGIRIVAVPINSTEDSKAHFDKEILEDHNGTDLAWLTSICFDNTYKVADTKDPLQYY
jgi:hypothetical protein